MDSKKSIIRTIYLYLFTLVGLFLIVIGGVHFLDMGLKAFVFTKAEEEIRLEHKQPPMLYSETTMKNIVKNKKISSDQQIEIENWIVDYVEWKGQKDLIDPVTSRRHREASINLAMMIVGLPLYLYHWRTIKKDQKKA